MQLIGMLDSPYVRRTAISLRRLGIAFEHRSLSVFRDFAVFHGINPVVKAPTLVLDDGTILVDSGLIIDYAETLTGHSLLPLAAPARAQALRRIGLALIACEKTVQWVYEVKQRPAEAQFQPWCERILSQLDAAWQALEADLQTVGSLGWLTGPEPGQADISIATAWTFYQHVGLDQRDDAPACPALTAFAARAEQRPEFKAFPLE
ncbi:glutathione S-transferase family protein [Frateuria aurantia]